MKDLFVTEGDIEQQRIDINDWLEFVTPTSMCGYNPISKEIIIVKSNSKKSSDNTEIANYGDCYVYSYITKSWTRGTNKFIAVANAGADFGTGITNFQNIGNNGDLSWLASGTVVETEEVV